MRVREGESVCAVCMDVCVKENARERQISVCVRESERERERERDRECVRERERVCVYLCVCKGVPGVALAPATPQSCAHR